MTVDNGVQTALQENYFFRDRIRFHCHVGFHVEGTEEVGQELECDENGQWWNLLTQQHSPSPCTSTYHGFL